MILGLNQSKNEVPLLKLNHTRSGKEHVQPHLLYLLHLHLQGQRRRCQVPRGDPESQRTSINKKEPALPFGFQNQEQEECAPGRSLWWA